MSANLYANEIVMAAKLLEREQVPADVEINFFRPGPMTVIAEWLENDVAEPTGKKWRHFDIGSGQEVSGGEPQMRNPARIGTAMTVIHDEIWPDHEFPQETFGYHADRNSVHDYGTPLRNEKGTRKTVESLKEDPKTYRLRIARYKLVEVEEIKCIGERPNLEHQEKGEVSA